MAVNALSRSIAMTILVVNKGTLMAVNALSRSIAMAILVVNRGTLMAVLQWQYRQ